jgi:hypothetical protein
MATSKGLFSIEKGEVKILLSKDVNYAFLDTEGDLWFNTQDGTFYSKKGFVVYKNAFEDYVGVNYYYSLNNTEFKKIKFKNANGTSSLLGKVILDKVTDKEDNIILKVERGGLRANDNKEITQTQVIESTGETRQNDVCFKLNNSNLIPENVSIVVPNSYYDTFKETVPGLFQKTVEGLIELKHSYIKYMNGVTEIQKLTLRNQDSISVFETTDPIIYFDLNDNTICLPKVLATDEINFIYNELVETSVYEETDYTPIIFDFTADFI